MEDCYFYEIFEKMQGNGSNVKPNALTISAVLLGLATNDGIRNKALTFHLIFEDVLRKYNVNAVDLQCNAKIAAFWITGRQIPMNDQDRVTFKSYETLSKLLRGRSKDDISECLHELNRREGHPRQYPKDAMLNLMLYDKCGTLWLRKVDLNDQHEKWLRSARIL